MRTFLAAFIGLLAASVSAQTPIISEIYLGNSGADRYYSFLEIYNPTDEAIDLTGWTVVPVANFGITNGFVTDFCFPLSGFIAPGEALTCGASQAEIASSGAGPAPYALPHDFESPIGSAWGDPNCFSMGCIWNGQARDGALLISPCGSVTDLVLTGFSNAASPLVPDGQSIVRFETGPFAHRPVQQILYDAGLPDFGNANQLALMQTVFNIATPSPVATPGVHNGPASPSSGPPAPWDFQQAQSLFVLNQSATTTLLSINGPPPPAPGSNVFAPDSFIVFRSTDAPSTFIPQNWTNYTVGSTYGDATCVYLGDASNFVDNFSVDNCRERYFYTAYAVFGNVFSSNPVPPQFVPSMPSTNNPSCIFTGSWPGGFGCAYYSQVGAPTATTDSLGFPTIAALSTTTPASTINITGHSPATPVPTGTGPFGPFIFAVDGTPFGGPSFGPAVLPTPVCGTTYTITARDLNGCTSDPLPVTPPCCPLVIGSSVGSNVTCFGGNDGSATATVTTAGLVGPTYTLTISPDPNSVGAQSVGVGTPVNYPNLPAGTYTVTGVDDGDASCTTTSTFTVTQPGDALATTGIFTNASCAAASNGSATLDFSTTTGGTPPFTVTGINDGGAPVPSAVIVGNTITGLPANTLYTVEFQDAAGCPYTILAPINNDGLDLATGASTTPTAATCAASDGSIDLTITAGAAPYTFSWTGPAGFSSTNEDISGLPAGGPYSVTVTDADGCTNTSPISASVGTTSPTLTPNATTVDANCGLSDGEITLAPTGGTAPYNVTGITPAGGTIAGLTVTGLAGGVMYTVDYADANGCTGTAMVTVNDAVAPVVAFNTPQTNVDCNGASTGAIDVNTTGGATPYTFAWTGPAGFSATTEDISGLAAGVYNLTVTDFNTCSSTFSVTITENPALDTLAAGTGFTNATCGLNNGSITIAATGGSGTYTTYLLDTLGATAQPGPNFANIPGGATYDVVVTDNLGCTGTFAFTISATPGVTVTETVTDVLCANDATGAIDLTVSGGSGGPYNFAWTGPGGFSANTEDLSGLEGGTYTVDVDDNAGCVVSFSYTVAEPGALGAGLVTPVTDETCTGASDGAIEVQAAGGATATDYTYTWTGPNGFAQVDGPTAASSALTGLEAGTYNLTVTDLNGCTFTDAYTVAAGGAAPAFTTSVSPADCGTITVLQVVPTATYEYSLDGVNFQAAATFTGQGSTAGDSPYTVTVRDVTTGCIATDNVTVLQIQPPVVTLAPANASCAAASDGSIALTVVSGVQPLTFLWSNGETTEDINGLAPGNYSVDVSDACGNAPAGFDTTVGADPDPMPGFTVLDGENQTVPNGGQVPLSLADITIQDNGLTSTYTFGDGTTLSGPAPSHTYTDAGTFTITQTVVGNDPACTATASQELEIITASLTLPNVITPNGDGVNDRFEAINGSPGFATGELLITDRWGNEVYSSNVLTWDGLDNNGRELPTGVYVYYYQVNLPDGRSAQRNGTLSLLR